MSPFAPSINAATSSGSARSPSHRQCTANNASTAVTACEGCDGALPDGQNDRRYCSRPVGSAPTGAVHRYRSRDAWPGEARHQKGTTRPGTGAHGVTHDGTAASRNGSRRYTLGAGVRIDTEEVTGSIPVSPTSENGLSRSWERPFDISS